MSKTQKRPRYNLLRPRYRYIRCGIVNYDGPISEYRLIASKYMGSADSCIRVCIPDDMNLTKLSCDDYSSTEDRRTLNELDYDVLIRCNGKWVIRNDLKGHQPHRFFHILMKESLFPIEKLGYVTVAQRDEYYRKRDKRIRAALREGSLPDEFSDRYAVVWGKGNDIEFVLSDDEASAEINFKSMNRCFPNDNVRLICPKKQGEADV